MPISIHYAEELNYEEAKLILEFHPERIGHGCYLVKRRKKKIETERKGKEKKLKDLTKR